MKRTLLSLLAICPAQLLANGDPYKDLCLSDLVVLDGFVNLTER